MSHTIPTANVPIRIWTDPAGVESQAMLQLQNIAALPWVFKHVAVMPDVHYGKGATVGSVIAMRGAVAPAAVGVDIGCGMGAALTTLRASDLPESLRELRDEVERAIPVGFNMRDAPLDDPAVHDLMSEFGGLDPAVRDLAQRAARQLGTLGGGNHFIELCVDGVDRVWLLLHSGSRNIGKTLADVHIARAKRLAHNAELPDQDLSVFLSGTPEMDAYRRDLEWAQRYAMENRKLMMRAVRSAAARVLGGFGVKDEVWCHHNYVSEEMHFGEAVLVTRKGAIAAWPGEAGIIPGSMGTLSYIVRGLGNHEAFCSASHGAGRRMSRNAARRRFTVADLEEQTSGVECRKDAGVVDEIPGAYKRIEEVMAEQSDLVEVVAVLKAVMCVKG